jgi:hypothetical protein
VLAWSLIRNEKPIVLFERHCHATEKSEAKEEERHMGSLTQKKEKKEKKKSWCQLYT